MHPQHRVVIPRTSVVHHLPLDNRRSLPFGDRLRRRHQVMCRWPQLSTTMVGGHKILTRILSTFIHSSIHRASSHHHHLSHYGSSVVSTNTYSLCLLSVDWLPLDSLLLSTLCRSLYIYTYHLSRIQWITLPVRKEEHKTC